MTAHAPEPPAEFTGAERGLVAFARALVATPSPPGEERAVSELLAGELRGLGYRDVSVDDVGNVVAWLGEGPPRLMFNGHLDHVPPADMEDPFSARLVDGAGLGGVPGLALRGRGSCDMKANVAAGAYAAAFLDGRELRGGSYVFTADVQEEIDSPVGIRALMAGGLRAEYGLSGESTGLDVCLGHRGKVRLEVLVPGRASHASTPQAGSNAVVRAAPFLEALGAAGEGLPADERYGRATLTVTGISSEPEGAVAVVPSRCTISVDRRYVPAETPESVRAELEDLVAGVAERTGIAAEVRLVDVYPLMAIDADHPLVRAGAAAVEHVTGRAPALRTWRFGVNATFMSEAGIPCIGIGPGNEDFAHTRDEHVSVAELVRAGRVYGRLVDELCGSAAGEAPRRASS